MNMLVHYDFVDRGLPTADEFYEGLTFLHSHGLIERRGKKYRQTEAGQSLCASARCKSEYETAKALAVLLDALPSIQSTNEIITKREAAFAVNCYGRLGCLLIFWPF